jgi:hypothetical protein
VYVIGVQFASYSLFQILPFCTFISFTGNVYPSPVHPSNSYHSLLAGAVIVNVSVSTVYGIVAFSHPVNVILYPIVFHVAVISLSSLSVDRIHDGVHPANSYPSLLNVVNSNSSP